MERERSLFIFKPNIKFQAQWTFSKILALGSVWAGYSNNYAVSVLKLSMYMWKWRKPCTKKWQDLVLQRIGRQLIRKRSYF